MSEVILKENLSTSIQGSNLQSSEKSKLIAMLHELQAPLAQIAQVPSRGSIVMSTFEAGLVGGGLGMLHAELKEGLDINGVPLDLGLALLSKLGAVVYRSERSNQISNEALAVYSFRTTDKLLSAIKERRAKERESVAQAAE